MRHHQLSDRSGLVDRVYREILGPIIEGEAFTEVLPCVAARWDVNANSTECTFHLRPGVFADAKLTQGAELD